MKPALLLRKHTAQFAKEKQTTEPRLVKCWDDKEKVGKSSDSFTSQETVSERGSREPEAGERLQVTKYQAEEAGLFLEGHWLSVEPSGRPIPVLRIRPKGYSEDQW